MFLRRKLYWCHQVLNLKPLCQSLASGPSREWPPAWLTGFLPPGPAPGEHCPAPSLSYLCAVELRKPCCHGEDRNGNYTWVLKCRSDPKRSGLFLKLWHKFPAERRAEEATGIKLCSFQLRWAKTKAARVGFWDACASVEEHEGVWYYTPHCVP